MQRHICSICGYVHEEEKNGKWEELSDDWKCPICGAGKTAFKKVEETFSDVNEVFEKPDVMKELTPMEMSIICSNLARGCEKQYMPEQSEGFDQLAEFFCAKENSVYDADTKDLLELIEKDLSIGYPYGNAVAAEHLDRGALRCLTWSEKVTRMLQSLLTRYEAEGDKMLENTGVYVCTICGFVFVGEVLPEICPVCKVPAWRFEKLEGRITR